MSLTLSLKPPLLQALSAFLPADCRDKGISLDVLRCDLIHPLLSGNKWYKLKYNLQAAQAAGQQTLLSFGGAWSNHLHALAAAASLSGLRSIGVVRGELPEPLSACLQDARAMGMTLHGIPRNRWPDKYDERFVTGLRERYGDFYLIPEGGANLAGIRGCMGMLDTVNTSDFDLIAVACGTGTTLTGLICSTSTPVLGVQILKGEDYLAREVVQFCGQYDLQPRAPYRIESDWHFGGYARTTPALLAFIREFSASSGLPLEPVYSGKLLYALLAMIRQGNIAAGSRILLIHGGGLQGARGFPALSQPQTW